MFAFLAIITVAFLTVWVLGTLWANLDSAPNWVFAIVFGVFLFLFIYGIIPVNRLPIN